MLIMARAKQVFVVIACNNFDLYENMSNNKAANIPKISHFYSFLFIYFIFFFAYSH